ncbi:ferrochelatase [Candidatus Acetothermia bacterium]|nr:ferrochelatase [Candidatus Acetothermia bacterium]
MKTGIILINFGEPTGSNLEEAIQYLTRIFFANANLEGATSDEERWARSRELAGRRAPSLIAAYEKIGGSPLNAQARLQAMGLKEELIRHGFDVETYVAMQFAEPYIPDVAKQAREDAVGKLIAIPVYPLCGPSTNVMALSELRKAIEKMHWSVPLVEITGWHRHPAYNRLRSENISDFLRANKISLQDDETRLVFSAHGTPKSYVEKGSRYVQYVEEYCMTISALLGVKKYELGYQNHSNRKIDWTQPNIEDVISSLNVKRVVLEPISFMHEQSETLAELDHEMRELAESRGLEFYRVPIPFDQPIFYRVLADLAEPFIAGIEPSYYQMRPCQCKPTPGTFCLNAPLEK